MKRHTLIGRRCTMEDSDRWVRIGIFENEEGCHEGGEGRDV